MDWWIPDKHDETYVNIINEYFNNRFVKMHKSDSTS